MSPQLPAPRFATPRLQVEPWGCPDQPDLAHLAAEILSPAVTTALPPGWCVHHDLDRAEAWVRERQAEGIALFLADRTSGDALGFLFLFEDPSRDAPTLRLGYLLRESAWGRGLASELLEGLITWCRRHGVRALIGGVEPGNLASARVLTKTGFTTVAQSPGGEDLYELRLCS
jgi:ribosomal-protein-alanine N-acetyltransferase